MGVAICPASGCVRTALDEYFFAHQSGFQFAIVVAGAIILLRELDRQARLQGGAVYMLNGNHESLNVAGNFRQFLLLLLAQGLLFWRRSHWDPCLPPNVEVPALGSSQATVFYNVEHVRHLHCHLQPKGKALVLHCLEEL